MGRTLHDIGVTSHMLSRSSDTLGDTNIFILIVSCLAILGRCAW